MYVVIKVDAPTDNRTCPYITLRQTSRPRRMSRGYQEILRQAKSSRIKHVYNALIEIRKTFIKTDKGVEILVAGGLVDRLLELLKTWETLEDKFKSKVVDICTSILGNICMLEVARKQVIKLNGISIVAQILLTSDCESVQNRCCRCLANIALSPGSWKLLHSACVIEKIIKLLNESNSDKCKQTYIRTIRLLGQTSKHVQDLLDKKCVNILASQLDQGKENTSQAVLRCLHSLSTHCCSIEFAAQIISSGKVEYLLSACKEKNLEAFQLIVRLCNLPVFRPEFGNTGGITIFLELFNSDEEFYKNLRKDMIDVLSLCCKEAVNRLKLRESGCLQKLMEVLLEEEYQMLHARVISALVCFLYDQYSFDILLENGLVHVLVKQLNKYMEQQHNNTEDDEEDVRHLQANKDCDNVTNNINVEVESQALKDGHGNVPQENIQEPCIKVHVVDYNKLKSEVTMLQTKTDTTPRVADTDDASVLCETDSEIMLCNKEGSAEEKVEPESPKERQRPLYSIDSPTYRPAVTWDEDEYNSGAKCIGRFTPPLDIDNNLPTKTYSPLSNSSYYSPSEGSPDYVYSSSSPNDKTVQSGEFSPQWPSSSNQDVTKVTKRIIYTGITTGISFNHSPNRCKSGLSSPVSTSDTDDFLYESDKDEEKSAPGIDPETDQTTLCEQSSDSTQVSTTCKVVERTCHDKSSQSNMLVMATEKTHPSYYYHCEENKKPERDKTESTTFKKRKKLQCKSVVFENNILILLSRTSQMTNPSKYLVTMETMTTLIAYIQHMEAPLARAARLLSRVFRNPLCFESLLNLNISTVTFQSLLIEENTRSLLSHVMKNRCDISKRRHSTSKLDTSSDEASDSDRFSVTCDSPIDEVIHPTKRQRTHSGEIIHVHHFKGTFHRQEEAVCDLGRCGIAFLEDLSEVLDSSYGRGVVEKLLCKESGVPKPDLCLALLFISWSSHSREYLCKQLNVLDQVLTLLQDQRPRQSSMASTAITALSFVLQAMDCGSKYRKKAVHGKNTLATSWLIEHSDKRKSGFETVNQERSCHTSTPVTELKCDSKNCIVDKELCFDVEFIIGEVKIGANRKVLTKSSDIFAAMLDGHYSEARQSAITMSNTSVKAFRYIIHYLHGCTIENCDEIASIYNQKVSRDSTIEFIKIITEVDKYLLLSLKDKLLDLLYSRYIIPESALPVLEFSVLHCYEYLQKSTIFVVMVDCDSVMSLIKFVNEILDSPLRSVFLQLLEDIITE